MSTRIALHQHVFIVLSLAALAVNALGPRPVLAAGTHRLFSRDGVDVWVVGDAGFTLRSLDGGATWMTTSLGAADLADVAVQGFQIWIVGAAGVVHHSTDSGGTWSDATLPGAPGLRAIEMIDASTGFVVGTSGTIFKTADGVQWVPQVSGTLAALNAVRFRDAQEGWAVGDGGTVVRTSNGGSNWTPVTVPTTVDLLALDLDATQLWVVGRNATALFSGDNGATWHPRDLRIDSRSQVTSVSLRSGSAVLCGGGSFLRRTSDAGATWQFFKHPLLAAAGDVYFTADGTKGWACSPATPAVVRTVDGGLTWTLPNGTSTSYAWSQRQAREVGSVTGNTLAQNWQNPNSIYGAIGPRVYKSLNRGDTWALAGTVPAVSAMAGLIVSPLDSLKLVALGDTPEAIRRSTDGGVTWSTGFAAQYSEFGIPLELDPGNPNRLLFAPDDGNLYESTDFGASFHLLSSPGFSSPCDVEISPVNSNEVFVTDGVTFGGGFGTIHRSTNGGLTFAHVFTGPDAEIPFLALSPHAPSIVFATTWLTGGVQRSLDGGTTWAQILTVNDSWGLDIAHDDPTVVIMGTLTANDTAYLSIDQGASFVQSGLPNRNLAMLALDRSTFIAQQVFGFYKVAITYNVPLPAAPSVQVTSPNGGETLTAGSTQTVTWSATNLALASIEYRTSLAAPWQSIGTAAGYDGAISWQVPLVSTTQAAVRVRNAWGTPPEDTSDTPFAIQAPSDADTSRPDPHAFALWADAAGTLRYELPRAVQVRIDLFDAKGRRVSTPVDAWREPGRYEVQINAGPKQDPSRAPGVYFARLDIAGVRLAAKVVVVR